jgi:serine/threonine protein kinase/tetratricopeptide (TPR) repeat protein
MMVEHLREAEAIFLAALDRTNPAERDAFVESACAGNAELLVRVRELLGCHDETSGPLDASPLQCERAPDAPPGEGIGTMIGPYKLVQEIGEGGMGTVYMAQQTEPVKRLVALKVIKPGMDSRQVIARFEAERQALALMDHPNIARVLDAGTVGSRQSAVGSQEVLPTSLPTATRLLPTEQGRPYFVMELVKGVPITRFCDERRLTPRERLELFVPVCQAVQHAHHKGIIHRDLKPSNILVALYDGRPVPKVIDFGIAKAAGQPLTDGTLVTGFGMIVGTLEYMSPEQAMLNALDIDTRSDVYSLGVLLYELLTGSTPLSRKQLKEAAMAEVLRLIREEEPPKPSTRLSTTEELPSVAANRGLEPKKLNGLVKGELDWIVMRALEKDRDRRYESANGLALDLLRYLHDEPVAACPPSTRYRLKKFLWRNKGPVLAAALLLGMMLAGIAGTTVGLFRARQAEAQALREKGDADIARKQAEHNFRKAREAVERFLQQIAQSPVLKQKGDLHALRKQLLSSALPFLEDFVKQQSDDPGVRFDQARAHEGLGVVRSEIGETEAALGSFTTAYEILAQLSRDHPAVPEYREHLAGMLNNRADMLQSVGKLTDADLLLSESLRLREKLVADFPAEPRFRLMLAETQMNQGSMFWKRGKVPEALTAYRRALAEFEKVAAESPRHPRARFASTTTNISLGNVLSFTDQPDQAEAAYRDALRHARELTRDFPADPAHSHLLVASQYRLGIQLMRRGKTADGMAEIQQAITLQEKLAEKFPAVPNYRKELGNIYQALGDQLEDLQKPQEAKAVYRKAISLQERLAAEFPSIPIYRLDLAMTYAGLGRLVRDRGELETALGWFGKAVPLLEVLVTQDSHPLGPRRFLADVLWSRTITYLKLGRTADVIADCERGLQLDDGSKRTELRLCRAESLARLGQTARAVTEAQEVAADRKLPANMVYNAAVVYALSAGAVRDDQKLRDRYAAEAIALLRRAGAAGHFDEPAQVVRMSEHHDLDALHACPDYQKLLKELRAKARSLAPKKK